MRHAGWQRIIPHRAGILILGSCCLLTSGCALGELGRSIFDSSARLFKPTSKDYADETDQKIDEWSQVGVEARGDQRRDHESDGLTNFMSSPKAQGIERNLGVD